MIAVIDYDSGNIGSVEKALRYIGADPIITREKAVIQKADKIVLPGVGAFGDAMERLIQYDLIELLKEKIKEGIPFLGICLGLQLLFRNSEESLGVQGMGLLEGSIEKIPAKGELKIPHIGWNSIKIKENSRLFRGIPQNSYVYFVHSYYLKAIEREAVAASTEYGVWMDTAVEKGNLFACQFHPEKSGKVGLEILKNFILL